MECASISSCPIPVQKQQLSCESVELAQPFCNYLAGSARTGGWTVRMGRANGSWEHGRAGGSWWS